MMLLQPPASFLRWDLPRSTQPRLLLTSPCSASFHPAWRENNDCWININHMWPWGVAHMTGLWWRSHSESSSVSVRIAAWMLYCCWRADLSCRGVKIHAMKFTWLLLRFDEFCFHGVLWHWSCAAIVRFHSEEWVWRSFKRVMTSQLLCVETFIYWLTHGGLKMSSQDLISEIQGIKNFTVKHDSGYSYRPATEFEQCLHLFMDDCFPNLPQCAAGLSARLSLQDAAALTGRCSVIKNDCTLLMTFWKHFLHAWLAPFKFIFLSCINSRTKILPTFFLYLLYVQWETWSQKASSTLYAFKVQSCWSVAGKVCVSKQLSSFLLRESDHRKKSSH